MQRLLARQPELRERPLALFADAPRGQQVVVTHDRLAASLGIRRGMPLAEAKTLCVDRRGRRSPCFLPSDSDTDIKALRRLAWSCDRFCPVIGLEQAEAPESLLLDITGCSPLFDGEDNLATELYQQVGRHGLHTRIAIADTLGAAWAIAHGGTRSQPIVILSGPDVTARLRSLPVTTLRLSPCLVAQLHKFQLRQIHQLLDLPRSSLPSRFGNMLLERLDQAFGTRPEEIIPTPRPEPITASWESETPLQSSAALEIVITQLLETVLEKLQQQGKGVSRLRALLTPLEHSPQTLSIDCVRPTTNLPHLLDLLQLRWERESFPQGICQIQLSILQTGRLTLTTSTLWPTEDTDGNDSELARLIERLSSRLGTDAVLRPVLVEDPLPERSFVYQPAVTDRSTEFPPERHKDVVQSHKLKTRATETGLLSRLVRPAWLLSAPISIEVLAIGDTGPPAWFRCQREYHITRHWGPERITTGWWRDNYIRRDYYHVETTDGQRFWIFCELVTSNWFLHATGT